MSYKYLIETKKSSKNIKKISYQQALTPWSNYTGEQWLAPQKFKKPPQIQKQISSPILNKHQINGVHKKSLQASSKYIRRKLKQRTIQSYLQNYYDQAFFKRQLDMRQSAMNSSSTTKYQPKIRKKREYTQSLLPHLKLDNPQIHDYSRSKPQNIVQRNLQTLQPKKYAIIQTRSKLKKNNLCKLMPFSKKYDQQYSMGNEALVAFGSRMNMECQQVKCEIEIENKKVKMKKYEKIFIEENNKEKYRKKRQQRQKRMREIFRTDESQINDPSPKRTNLRQKLIFQVLGKPTTKLIHHHHQE